jgi:hypothetical protein
MNEPKLIEQAIAKVLRAVMDPLGVAVRCWRTPADAPEIDADGNMVMPMIGVTCETPTVSEQYQREARVVMTVMTRAADDLLRENITEIETLVLELAEQLDKSSHGYTTGAAYDSIVTDLEDVSTVLAISMEPGTLPQTMQDNHTSTITVKVDWQRKQQTEA